MSISFRHFKVITYSLLGAGVMGIGLSLALSLDKIIVLPFFPDILDAVSIFAAGGIVLGEVVKEARKSPHI